MREAKREKSRAGSIGRGERERSRARLMVEGIEKKEKDTFWAFNLLLSYLKRNFTSSSRERRSSIDA